jgi:steroid delta-isomerase-like uncharacterized protein
LFFTSQFTKRQKLFGTTLRAASWSSASGDAGKLLKDTTSIDTNSIQCVIESFRDWYSSPTELEPQQEHLMTTLLPQLLAENVTWDDCHYTYQPLVGNDTVERQLRLQKVNLLGSVKSPRTLVVDEVIVATASTDIITVGFTFHESERTNGSAEGMALPNRRGIVLLDVERRSGNDNNGYRITAANIIREKSSKTGELSLRILSLASNFLRRSPQQQVRTSNSTEAFIGERTKTLPEQYFEAWNQRDMESAVSLFADDISYDDTAFPVPFVGKDCLQQHLLKCANCFPASFTFCVDSVIQQDTRIVVSWHVENNNDPLPFTNGLSYYETNPLGDKISKGIDYVDSESIKVASTLDLMSALYQYEPSRLVPTIVWLAYIYIVFVSDGILPGANALQLETRTWEEVRDLSLNFFLVAPFLQLPFSPSVHPMLESVFNVLLSWAAMFAGFLSDDRKSKPNFLPM